MLNKVALLDLEQHLPTAHSLRDLLEQNDVVYLFDCRGQFHYALADLTELATWICSGEVVILETAKSTIKEYEYAMLVGQLLALVDAYTQVELLSAMPSCSLLLQLMQDAEFNCHLTPLSESIPVQVQSAQEFKRAARASVAKALQPIRQHPRVDQLLNRCIDKLHQQPVNALRPLSRWLESLRYHPSLMQQAEPAPIRVPEPAPAVIEVIQAPAKPSLEQVQAKLYQNFSKVDRVQVAVLRKLNQLQSEKPKDIYALRDFLAAEFPESDIGMLLKELLEKGYIYWNGHEVIYSHEMVLN